MTLRVRLAAPALAVCLFAGIPAIAADCAACHPAEAKSHARTAHASALVPALRSSFAAHLPSVQPPHAPLGEAAGGYMFEYERAPDGIIAVAQRGGDRAEGLIQWVLGSGRRGQTPLIVVAGRVREHRVSFYAETGKYGITTGQPDGASPNAIQALGIAQSDHDLKSCLNCHSAGNPSDLTTFVPGVQCARCHAGAEEHANGHGKPVNPGKLDRVAQVQLCGTCHRVAPQPGHDNEIANVRFQPLRLMKSRCFREAQITCTTCHPAHMDAFRDQPDFYNRKCMDCHGAQQQHVRVQKSADCLSCHMPRRRPHPALEFTDHFIRVVANN